MAKRSKETRLVALIVDAARPYHRKMIPGVTDYANEVGNWRLYVEEGVHERLPDLRAWHGDGIITTFEDPKVIERVGRLKIPVVGMERCGDELTGRIPTFGTNNLAIGRLGAEHLIDLGFRRLAYCGFPRSRLTRFSHQRAEAFERRAAQAGCSCSIYTGRHLLPRKWAALQRGLVEWLLSFETPLGLMAANDARARHVLEACRTAGLRVPEDVAVLGVDNDEILCEVMQPPLSSIEQGARAIGYRSAECLDGMISGQKPRMVDTYIDPERLVKRQSTDTLAIEDPDISAAVRFIRERAFDQIQVTDLVEHVQLSRSTLEARFKALLGRTIHAEIRRIQLEHAKNLVAYSNLSLKQIATRSGFSHVQHMTNIFRQQVGKSPGEYRKQARWRKHSI